MIWKSQLVEMIDDERRMSESEEKWTIKLYNDFSGLEINSPWNFLGKEMLRKTCFLSFSSLLYKNDI